MAVVFADQFNGTPGTPVGNGWQFKPKPESSTVVEPWVYENGRAVRGGVSSLGGASSLMYRPGTTVPTGGTYDVRWRFQDFNFAECFFRYSSTVGRLNDRLAILIQNDVGKIVSRNDNGEILLHNWVRQPSEDYEVYLYVSGDVINVFDSGFMGNADHQVWATNTAHLNGNTGIGVGNGRITEFIVSDYSAGYADVLMQPAQSFTRVEGDGDAVDEVTAEPALEQVEDYAGITLPAYTIVSGEPRTADGLVPAGTPYLERAGRWRAFARAPGEPVVEFTMFRGAPTLFEPWAFGDPFGPATASFVLPEVTIFDKPGINDLAWLSPNTDIDLVFEGTLPATYPGGKFVWEGFVTSWDYSDDGLQVQLLGAMFQLDHHLAKPNYPQRPLPYELAIANQFKDRPDLRLRDMKVEWPAGWNTYYTEDANTPLYMRPLGVKSGDPWTGLVTRQTGQFDQSLSSYVQTLLTSMYTETGRWTLDLDPGRQPVLRHRTFKTAVDSSTIVVDPAAPGVKISMSVDWSQTTNATFGQGVSLTGEGWGGQDASLDGNTTTYQPLAARSSVHPLRNNPNLKLSVMRREVMLQLQEGLTIKQARTAAKAHLERFAEPGFTGTITLGSDPKLDGAWLPRKTIKAGMSVWVPHIAFDGVMFHITKVSTDRDGHTVTLTVDSKYRDQLTVDEVRLRGRDSLAITRSLIGGQYAPPIPDQLVPWNYAEGSGYIPSSPPDPDGSVTRSAQPLFDGMDPDIDFPWTRITTARPPKDPLWAPSYIRIGPASTNADDNWGVRHVNEASGQGITMAFPVRAAQQARIRLLQIAAVNRDGYVMKVPFHVSFYGSRGTNVQAMPRMNPADALQHPPYQTDQHYPFFEQAFERYRSDGTQTQTEVNQATTSSGLIRGYGTKAVPAGYWPNPPGTRPTGLLVDEGTFEIDTTRFDSEFTPFQTRQRGLYTGCIFVMIYCDAQGANEVFFVGRMYRAEPGSTV